MSDNIFLLDENRPHVEGPVLCRACFHVGVVVRPVGTLDMKCTRCGAMAGEALGKYFQDTEGGIDVLRRQLLGRAKWYDDCASGAVKTPQLLRKAAAAIAYLMAERGEDNA